jgi:dihydrofolate reductase
MRKLIETTLVTLDGVIGDTAPSTAPHASPEKWGYPYWDEEHGAYAHKLLFAADALLLGRATYEGFAESWGQRSGDEFADRMNAMPKYVASHTLTEATWNSTVITGDVAEEVRRLKDQPGQSILKYGTGELDRTLMEHNLVDEFHFWMFPVAVGGGQRLFEGIDTTHLKLVDSTRFNSGIVVLVFTQQ